MSFSSTWSWSMSQKHYIGSWSITAMWTRGCLSSMWNFIRTKYNNILLVLLCYVCFDFWWLSIYFIPSQLCPSQIFRGLAYIHSVPGVCHRDVKPQNLLVCISSYHLRKNFISFMIYKSPIKAYLPLVNSRIFPSHVICAGWSPYSPAQALWFWKCQDFGIHWPFCSF